MLSISAQGNVEEDTIGTTIEAIAAARWLTGKIGFTLAALALIIAARQQWKAGLPLKKIAPLSALLGIAMLFIWLDAATIVHRITGIVFLLWLVIIGFMLITGRVERHFVSQAASDHRL